MKLAVWLMLLGIGISPASYPAPIAKPVPEIVISHYRYRKETKP